MMVIKLIKITLRGMAKFTKYIVIRNRMFNTKEVFMIVSSSEILAYFQIVLYKLEKFKTINETIEII